MFIKREDRCGESTGGLRERQVKIARESQRDSRKTKTDTEKYRENEREIDGDRETDGDRERSTERKRRECTCFAGFKSLVRGSPSGLPLVNHLALSGLQSIFGHMQCPPLWACSYFNQDGF